MKRETAVAVATAILMVSVPVDAQTSDYDSDDDGLIEISQLEQLDAIRWDLDGDGVASSDAGAYSTAFPGASEGMGCPGGVCSGYELVRALDFANSTSYASRAVRPEWIQGSGWLPVGDGHNPFAGVFDGNGHTVANLFIDRTGQNNTGLFSSLSGTVRRLGATNLQVRGATVVGGLVGVNRGTITASHVIGEVTGSRDTGGLVGSNHGTVDESHAAASVSAFIVVGGLVGYNYGIIGNSRAMGHVSSMSRVAGGLAGINRGRIQDSHAAGKTSGSDLAGGLVGLNQGPISESRTDGTVSVRGDDAGGLVGVNYDLIDRSHSTVDVSGNHRIGGLVGYNNDTGTVNASSASGDVAGNMGAGGLAGWNNGTIGKSYATGGVVGSEDDLGGLVGRNSGNINASYAIGDVSGYHRVGGLVGYGNLSSMIQTSYARGDVAGGFEAGGLAGWNHGTIDTSYAVGAVEATRDAGGLVGENTGTVRASFWDVAMSGQQAGVGYGSSDGMMGTDLQSAARDLQAIWNPDLWDFATPGRYPALKVDFDGDGKVGWEEFGDQ